MELAEAGRPVDMITLAEELSQGDHVHRSPRLRQFHDAAENAAVGIQREIVRAQQFGGLVVGQIIQQDGAQDATFRIHARRQTAFEAVVGGSQGPSDEPLERLDYTAKERRK